MPDYTPNGQDMLESVRCLTETNLQRFILLHRDTITTAALNALHILTGPPVPGYNVEPKVFCITLLHRMFPKPTDKGPFVVTNTWTEDLATTKARIKACRMSLLQDPASDAVHAAAIAKGPGGAGVMEVHIYCDPVAYRLEIPIQSNFRSRLPDDAWRAHFDADVATLESMAPESCVYLIVPLIHRPLDPHLQTMDERSKVDEFTDFYQYALQGACWKALQLSIRPENAVDYVLCVTIGRRNTPEAARSIAFHYEVNAIHKVKMDQESLATWYRRQNPSTTSAEGRFFGQSMCMHMAMERYRIPEAQISTSVIVTLPPTRNHVGATGQIPFHIPRGAELAWKSSAEDGISAKTFLQSAVNAGHWLPRTVMLAGAIPRMKFSFDFNAFGFPDKTI